MINIGYTKDMNRYSNQLIFDILTTGEELVKNWWMSDEWVTDETAVLSKQWVIDVSTNNSTDEQ